jgi:hypothetical protein
MPGCAVWGEVLGWVAQRRGGDGCSFRNAAGARGSSVLAALLRPAPEARHRSNIPDPDSATLAVWAGARRRGVSAGVYGAGRSGTRHAKWRAALCMARACTNTRARRVPVCLAHCQSQLRRPSASPPEPRPLATLTRSAPRHAGRRRPLQLHGERLKHADATRACMHACMHASRLSSAGGC